jgi:hypothetical protein
MVALRAVPDVVDITAYAGDTLTIEIVDATGYSDGLDWNAQIRADRTSSTIDATFTVTPPVSPGLPAFLVLSAAVSRTLIGSLTEYKGVWDCQVSDAGNDPVTTLVQGTFTLMTDVTRVTP